MLQRISSGRIALAALCVGFILWLALLPTPREKRVRAINAAFEDGRLGPLRDPFEQKLEDQIEWLLAAAGVRERVFVNQGVDPDRLDLIVTKPELEAHTACGRGNAVYDPDLDAIFIDSALVLPDDIFMIGESYAGALIDAENTDFHYSYLGFIIAHELGHRQVPEAGGRATAFFHYAAPRADLRAAEVAADRFAIETMLNGILSLGPLDFLEYHDVLEIIGLDLVEVSPRDYAAAEILGAVYMMSEILLFSESPYSPFHFDEEHPSFVERSLEALDRIEQEPNNPRTKAHLSFFVAQMSAFRRLSELRFKEVYFDEPLFRLAYRKDRLWFGTHRLPTLNRGRVFSVAPSELAASEVVTDRPVLARFERATSSEVAATDWLNAVFDPQGGGLPMPPGIPDPATILPPVDPEPETETLTLPPRHDWLVRDHGLRVEAAVRVEDSWFIPGFPPYGGDDPQRWTLWRYRPDADPEVLIELPFLISSVKGPAEGAFLRDRDPYLIGLQTLQDGRLVIWFGSDAMYLVDPDLRRARLIFTPVRAGLQIVEVPSRYLVIWMYNCKKAYLATLEREGQEDETR